MKLTIKTLQGQIFKVDIEPDKLVKELKDTIEKEQGKEYAPSLQKLIYNGKILTDETKLAEYEFDEKKFIVLMVTRPIPVPKPAPERETTTSKGQSAGKPSTDEKAASKQSASQPQSGPQTAVSAGQQQQSAAQPAQHTTTTTTTTSNSQSAAAPTGRASALNDLAALSMGEPHIANRLAVLMTQPQFRQMQDLIQQNPHLLSSTIESLAVSDPETYSFISENPDIFANALNHPQMLGGRSTTTTASSRASQQHSQTAGRGGAGSDGSSGPAVGLQQPVVSQLTLDVSEHDKEAIERLKELGFSEFQAVQAYMACDKDEQLAANLLFQMDQ